MCASPRQRALLAFPRRRPCPLQQELSVWLNPNRPFQPVTELLDPRGPFAQVGLINASQFIALGCEYERFGLANLNELSHSLEYTVNDATARDKPERSHVSGTFELKDSAMNSASDCIVRTPAQSSHAAD